MRWIVVTVLLLSSGLSLAEDQVLLSQDRAVTVSNDSGTGKSTITLIHPRTKKILGTLILEGGPEKTSITTGAALSIGPGAWAIVASKGHSNSSESFITYQVLAAINDRIFLVYEGPFLYGIVTDTGERIGFSASFSVLDTSTGGYKDILLKVSENIQDDRGKVTQTVQTYQAVLHWDAAQHKYLGHVPKLKHRVDQLWKKYNS